MSNTSEDGEGIAKTSCFQFLGEERRTGRERHPVPRASAKEAEPTTWMWDETHPHPGTSQASFVSSGLRPRVEEVLDSSTEKS